MTNKAPSISRYLKTDSVGEGIFCHGFMCTHNCIYCKYYLLDKSHKDYCSGCDINLKFYKDKQDKK